MLVPSIDRSVIAQLVLHNAVDRIRTNLVAIPTCTVYPMKSMVGFVVLFLFFMDTSFIYYNDGLAQDCSNSSASAMNL